MAVLRLEDLTGSCEAVVFPKSFARLADHLILDARLLVWAGVDRRDERVQLIVDDCCSIDDLHLLVVDLPVNQAGDTAVQHRLRDCLQRHRPDAMKRETAEALVPVVARVLDGERGRCVQLGAQFCVADGGSTARALCAAGLQASLVPLLDSPGVSKG